MTDHITGEQETLEELEELEQSAADELERQQYFQPGQYNGRSAPRRRRCVCGQPATQDVVVHWKNGPRTYRYCQECAEEICENLGGCELLP